jgi:hypothetical protein
LDAGVRCHWYWWRAWPLDILRTNTHHLEIISPRTDPELSFERFVAYLRRSTAAKSRDLEKELRRERMIKYELDVELHESRRRRA